MTAVLDPSTTLPPWPGEPEGGAWRRWPACRGMGPELFFPRFVGPDASPTARAVCAGDGPRREGGAAAPWGEPPDAIGGTWR
ncbi:MAG: hypothetical protein ACRD0L_04245 [Acidimicrobiales bacterium]